MLAEARMRVGNLRAALEAIDRALVLARRPRPDYMRLRGRILVMLGDNEAAIRAFAVSRRYAKELPVEFVPDLARALYARGSDEAARKVLERALQGARPAPTALLLYGREEAQRDPKGARAALERGMALYPELPSFGELLVGMELRAGNKDKALAMAREAAARLPDMARTQMTLARTLIANGQGDEAVQQAELVQQRWPGQPGVAELYLDVMAQAGRADEAFQALTEQRAAGTLLPNARVLLARLYAARGEQEQAIELLRSALADQPELPAAQNDLAYMLARGGEELEKATELAQEARANRPDSPEIADTLGFVYLRRNLAEAALVQFDASLQMSEPGSSRWAVAQYHRGLALRQLGRQADAVAALEQALASGAEFAEAPDAHQVLAELGSAGGASAPEGS
jgi:tetratricopeptide (TPR) repeat protein